MIRSCLRRLNMVPPPPAPDAPIVLTAQEAPMAPPPPPADPSRRRHRQTIRSRRRCPRISLAPPSGYRSACLTRHGSVTVQSLG